MELKTRYVAQQSIEWFISSILSKLCKLWHKIKLRQCEDKLKQCTKPNFDFSVAVTIFFNNFTYFTIRTTKIIVGIIESLSQKRIAQPQEKVSSHEYVNLGLRLNCPFCQTIVRLERLTYFSFRQPGIGNSQSSCQISRSRFVRGNNFGKISWQNCETASQSPCLIKYFDLRFE